jgi:hypothetical protein
MVESTRSSSSEVLMFLCTTAAFHSLPLLCSSLGLTVVLEEGELGGTGAMLV